VFVCCYCTFKERMSSPSGVFFCDLLVRFSRVLPLFELPLTRRMSGETILNGMIEVSSEPGLFYSLAESISCSGLLLY